ncbi:MAG TPA: hypothetical protein VJ859_02930 [Allosphingosinicella sp.]|nr:hypothetical protein [Allosphingosinicella sp.]
MKFRFTGRYTNGHTSINVGGSDEAGGVTFHGDEPAEVKNEGLIERLSKHPEFEAVGKLPQLDHDGDGAPGGSTAPDGDKEAMKALREEYEFKMGKKAFPGWDEATLREKMAAA